MDSSFSTIAVKGISKDAVLKTLSLRGTNVFEASPESSITGAQLPSGWYLATSHSEHPAFNDDKTFQELSQDAELATLMIDEHVMYSVAAFWAKGQRVWWVMHHAQLGLEHLETKGAMPQGFDAIREKLQAQQKAAGPDSGKNYIFDTPIALVAHFTGYRHDQETPNSAEKLFEVLSAAPPPPKPGLFKKLFGG